jgi:hypothetical protein
LHNGILLNPDGVSGFPFDYPPFPLIILVSSSRYFTLGICPAQAQMQPTAKTLYNQLDRQN